MKRREATFFLAALPLTAFAQQRGQPARIGFLYFASQKSAIDTRRYPSFLQGMAEHGYAEGRNLVVEARFADGRSDRLPALAAELLRSQVDIIVAGGNAAINAAYRATKTIPIVIAQSPDPVAQGWAASLARPGGNITGLVSLASEIELKMLEFLRSTVPSLARLAILANPSNRTHPSRIAVLRDAGQKVGIAVVPVAAQTPAEIEHAFSEMKNARAQALIMLGDTYFLSQARLIATRALNARLPSAHTISDYADAGGFLAFGPDIPDNFRRAAGYVDKILKGAKPGELPIEQPAKFDLVLNLKTAKSLGVRVPQPMLLRATRVIE
jgi:putative ABC transport system substrate-binding protein